MTAGDWIAVGVLVGFATLALTKWFQWIMRALLGGLLGAAVLVAIGYAGNVPWLGRANDLLAEGKVSPALQARADQAAVALGWKDPATEYWDAPMQDEPAFVIDPRTGRPVGKADPLAWPDAWNVQVVPAQTDGD